MSDWIICYNKNNSEDKPSKVQINRDAVKTISLYGNHLEIEFIDNSCRSFYFSEWDIKL